MIEEIDDYFAKGCGRCPRFDTKGCSTRKWAAGLADLRRICLSSGLTETVRWGHPCYRGHGRNIAIIGAFRDDFRLSFFNAALMQDPENILEKQGSNTKHADMIRFASNVRPAALAPAIRSYLEEAAGYAQAGATPPKRSDALEPLEQVSATLEADPELAAAFHALTPGRRRSYVINLTSAMKSETRKARIAKFRDKIIAGEGATER